MAIEKWEKITKLIFRSACVAHVQLKIVLILPAYPLPEIDLNIPAHFFWFYLENLTLSEK